MKQCLEKARDVFKAAFPPAFSSTESSAFSIMNKVPEAWEQFLLIPLGHTKEQYHVFERISSTNIYQAKQHWLPSYWLPDALRWAPSKVFSSSNVYFPGCTQYMTLKLKSVPLPVNISSVFWYVHVLNPKALKISLFCVHLQMYKLSTKVS